jgi:hypothetical protein
MAFGFQMTATAVIKPDGRTDGRMDGLMDDRTRRLRSLTKMCTTAHARVDLLCTQRAVPLFQDWALKMISDVKPSAREQTKPQKLRYHGKTIEIRDQSSTSTTVTT